MNKTVDIKFNVHHMFIPGNKGNNKITELGTIFQKPNN